MVDLKKFYKNLPKVLDDFQFKEHMASVILVGAKDSGRGKLLAGVSRAAFRSDAVIIDSGVATGIESYCLRRKVPLIGVFPEEEIELPKINATSKSPNQLTNGHSHLFMLCKSKKWGTEAKLKYQIARKYIFLLILV